MRPSRREPGKRDGAMGPRANCPLADYCGTGRCITNSTTLRTFVTNPEYLMSYLLSCYHIQKGLGGESGSLEAKILMDVLSRVKGSVRHLRTKTRRCSSVFH